MARSTRSSTRASSSNETTVTSSETNNQQDGTTIANQNVIVAKQVIKCPKFKEVSPQHIADKLVQYERYLREHDIDPEKVSAARLQNNCSEELIRTIKVIKHLNAGYEFQHEELLTHLKALAAQGVQAQEAYDSWAKSRKIKLIYCGRGESAVAMQFADLIFKLAEEEKASGRRPLDLTTHQGRVDRSKMFSNLLPVKFRTRFGDLLRRRLNTNGFSLFDRPDVVRVEELFKQVLASLNEDLYEMNFEHQAEIDNGVKPKKSKQDKRPAQAKKRAPRQFPKRKFKCHICGKVGHLANKCWHNKNKSKRPNQGYAQSFNKRKKVGSAKAKNGRHRAP